MTAITKLLSIALLTLALVGLAAPAHAQGVGVRAGASVDPDQFYFGGHFETPALVDRVHLRPNLEIGVGDNVTLVAVNIEAVYKYPLSRSAWTLYGGGGPAINFYNFDDDGFGYGGRLQLRRRARARPGTLLRDQAGCGRQPRSEGRHRILVRALRRA